MRTAVFLFFAVMGLMAGLFAALDGYGGLKLVFAAIGMVVGLAVGGALSRVGRRTQPKRTDADGLDEVQREQVRNYWLDRARATASPGLPHLDDSDPQRGGD